MQTIKSALETEINAWHMLEGGFTYTYMRRLILTHGKPWMRDRRRVHGGSTPKLCYKNALEQAAFEGEGWYYVEGVGLSALGIVLDHAWVGTPEGTAWDPTWGVEKYHKDTQYYGIAFPAREAVELIAERGCYGLFDLGDPWSRKFMAERFPDVKLVKDAA